MTLRNRWIVRTVNTYTYDGPETYCVECRATCRVIFYGDLRTCVKFARERNRAASR